MHETIQSPESNGLFNLLVDMETAYIERLNQLPDPIREHFVQEIRSMRWKEPMEQYGWQWSRIEEQNDLIQSAPERRDEIAALEIPNVRQYVIGSPESLKIIELRNYIYLLKLQQAYKESKDYQIHAEKNGATWFQHWAYEQCGVISQLSMQNYDMVELQKNISHITKGRIAYYTFDDDPESLRTLFLFTKTATKLPESTLVDFLDQNPVEIQPGRGYVTRESEYSPEKRLARLVFSGLLDIESFQLGRFEMRLRRLDEIMDLKSTYNLTYKVHDDPSKQAQVDYKTARIALNQMPPEKIEVLETLLTIPGGVEYLLTYSKRLGIKRLQAISRLLDYHHSVTK